jgi:xanthine dehydrogenase YagR molybdenum-binding subunit
MPAFAASTRVVRADVGTPTAMRAPHEGPGMFALESAMDELAYASEIDPLELRLRNHADIDPLSGKPFSSKKLREVYEEGARRFGWARRPPAPRSMTDGGKLIGWGMASAIMSTFRFASTARVRLAASGDITVEAGCQEIGTGPYTIMPQLAAEVLGVPPERVIDASVRLKARLAAIAGAAAAPAPETWGELLRAHRIDELKAEGAFALPGKVAFDAHGGQSGFAMYTWGAVFVEMEVDEFLGLARMRRCVAGYSAGRIVNPLTARSQMIGGIIWGYGRAMLEQSAMDARYGRYVSKNLSGVMLPVNADIPQNIDVFFADEYDPHASSLGARGIGELGEVGVAAAITNALFHATGKRIRTLPVRIESLLA